MTCRDLIIYILQHNLEDTELVRDGKLTICMDEEQAAVRFNVGVASIRAMVETGVLKGFEMGGTTFLLVPSLAAINPEEDS